MKDIDAPVYNVSTFRTLGIAGTPQHLFTIGNPAGSAYLVAVDLINFWFDSTAVLVSVAPSVNLSRPASLPTSGTTLTAVATDSAAITPTAICRGGTASDGGGATAITVTAGTSFMRGQVTRLHTAVGEVITGPFVLWSGNAPIILRAGQSVLVQSITANAATSHFMVNCQWREFESAAQ